MDAGDRPMAGLCNHPHHARHRLALDFAPIRPRPADHLFQPLETRSCGVSRLFLTTANIMFSRVSPTPAHYLLFIHALTRKTDDAPAKGTGPHYCLQQATERQLPRRKRCGKGGEKPPPPPPPPKPTTGGRPIPGVS
jgi:hypothetical protein